jgi:hypothetical protein
VVVTDEANQIAAIYVVLDSSNTVRFTGSGTVLLTRESTGEIRKRIYPTVPRDIALTFASRANIGVQEAVTAPGVLNPTRPRGGGPGLEI